MWNLYTDLVLRALMGFPGRCLEGWERLQGARDTATGWPADAVMEQIKATARSPEAWLGLEQGLEHVQSANGVVAYRVRGNTGFSVGGLNAPVSRRRELLQSYLDAARARGCRRMLTFPVRSDELADVAACGMGAIHVGMEAWLDLRELTFQGAPYAHVRQMSNRAGRRGVEVSVLEDPTPQREELEQVHERWLETRRPSWRMALLIGTPCLERPFGRRYVVATRGGRICAFLTLVPAGEGSAAIDVMCRAPDAPAGTMERLVVSTVSMLRAEGLDRLSMGPCPMAGLETLKRWSSLHVVFAVLYKTSLGNRIFGFQGLERFKDKFRPRWEPIFIAASPRVNVMTLYMGCRMWRLL